MSFEAVYGPKKNIPITETQKKYYSEFLIRIKLNPSSNNLSKKQVTDILSFEAEKIKNTRNVHLSWEIVSLETEIQSQSVEYSVNGSDWTSIGTVLPINKVDGSIEEYSFVHRNIESPVNFYRVKITDVQGQSNHTRVRLIRYDEDQSPARLTIYPNPAKDFIRVEMDLTQSTAFEIYATTGKLVLSGLGFTQYDFQSVALHELGHGHQLGHVIDLSSHTDNNGDIMYYAISNSEQQRVLHPDNITAGNYVQTINESSVPAFNCYSGTSAMTAYVCNLSVDDVAFNENVTPDANYIGVLINKP